MFSSQGPRHEQNVPDKGEGRDPRKLVGQGGPDGNDLSKAFKWTFFPILIGSVVSLLGAGYGGLYYVWFIAAAYAAGAGVVAISILLVAALNWNRSLASGTGAGTLAGFAVGAIALAATCFVNLSTIGSIVL